MVKKRFTGEERRRSILEAAVRCIAKTSFERCTTAMIAKEAGVTEPLIYNHFSTKKELLLAVLESIRLHFLELTAAMDALPGLSLVEMREFGKGIQSDIKTNPDRVSVVLKAMAVEDPDMKDKVWEIALCLRNILVSVLEKGRATQKVAYEEQTVMLAWFALAWGVNLSLINQLGRLDELPEDAIDRFVAFVDHALRVSAQP